jgi:hypothetical protein
MCIIDAYQMIRNIQSDKDTLGKPTHKYIGKSNLSNTRNFTPHTKVMKGY